MTATGPVIANSGHFVDGWYQWEKPDFSSIQSFQDNSAVQQILKVPLEMWLFHDRLQWIIADTYPANHLTLACRRRSL